MAEEEATHERGGASAIHDVLSLFASCLSHHRFGDEDLRVLEAALSAGVDVTEILHTRSEARRLLRERSAEAFSAAAVEEVGARLSVFDFFARAFDLVGDVESCLAMRYEALVLREARCSDDLHLRVSHEEWLSFAKDSLDNGFYTIASKAFANAFVHIHPSHLGNLDSTNSILKKDKINEQCKAMNSVNEMSAKAMNSVDEQCKAMNKINEQCKAMNSIRGLQNLAKTLSAKRSGEFCKAMNSVNEMLRNRSSINLTNNLNAKNTCLVIGVP